MLVEHCKTSGQRDHMTKAFTSPAFSFYAFICVYVLAVDTVQFISPVQS